MVALYDYDPYTMGTTDRPELQLSLRKGDLLKIYGTVNTDGYYVAVLNGKIYSDFNPGLALLTVLNLLFEILYL